MLACISLTAELLMWSNSRPPSLPDSPSVQWPFSREPFSTVPFSVGPGPQRGCQIAVPGKGTRLLSTKSKSNNTVQSIANDVVYHVLNFLNMSKIFSNDLFTVHPFFYSYLHVSLISVKHTTQTHTKALKPIKTNLEGTFLLHLQRDHHIWCNEHKLDENGDYLRPVKVGNSIISYKLLFFQMLISADT